MPAPNKDLIAQESHASKALGNPLGTVWYVDSSAGNNANDGLSARHPVSTLVYALSLAAAGDTIMLAPGGSESLTSTVTVSLEGVRIVCPVSHPQQGYELTGAGSLDLLTVSAADVLISGLRFTRTAGAGSTTAGILTTSAADRLHVRNCAFDYTALTSAWTNYGVELTDACNDVLIEGCTFLDCHRGVVFAVATGINCLRPRIAECLFLVGQTTAFGVHASPAGTGTVRGMVIERCLFVEADGSGAVATDPWDGTDNTNATSGPLLFSAAVDQFMVTNCRASEARSVAFESLNAVTSGALGDFSSNASGTGSDITAGVTSVGVLVSTAISATQSHGTATSTGLSSGLSATVSLGTASSTGLSSALSATVSYGVAGSTANSSGLSAGVSVGLVASSALSAIQSYGTAGSTANSSGLSATVSLGTASSTGLSSALSATVSYGVAGSSANSSGLSATVSLGTASSTGLSSALSATVSYGVAGSTANSSSLSATVSLGTANSTAHSTAISTINRSLIVVKTGLLADNAIDNNTQGSGNTLCTAAGDVYIEDVIIAKDATALTGPTNVEVSTNNVYGDTGVNDPSLLISTATLAATTRVARFGTSTWSTLKLPLKLEAGKKLFIHGDDSAGTSAGSVSYCVIGYALSAGGSLS